MVELLGHLCIERAHFAAGGAPTLTDWHGLVTRHPERIASLTVVSPPILDGSELAAVASRLLVVGGDEADTGQVRCGSRPTYRMCHCIACAATRRNRG